jgi:threonine synthase
MPKTTLTHLACPICGRAFDHTVPQTWCHDCSSPLEARYDLARARRELSPSILQQREGTLWRYRELLPVADESAIVTLGEGWTPVLRAERLGVALGCPRLSIKEEGYNPTGSFKARGIAVAVSMARQFGIRTVAMPSAGNAGGALAAYAARAGMEAHIYIPSDTPVVNREENAYFGARTHLVDGLISDAAALLRKENAGGGFFDMSTMKEPYRLEGKKTMGYEVAEQFAWKTPDVILYPTGGGTGLIGMWKAFRELEELGWIGGRKPRMIAVQSSGCAPVVAAFDARGERIGKWPDAATIASGLRVPQPFADRMILAALRESGGTAIAVDDALLPGTIAKTARLEGILLSPEGAAAVAAIPQLIGRGSVDPAESILVYNTGSGYKYREVLAVLPNV